MVNDVSLDIDLETIRKPLYELIESFIEEDAIFACENDYNFFVDNIAKQGVPILAYTYRFIKEEYKTKTMFIYTYIEDNNFYIGTLYLLDKNESFELPKYESGEHNND